VHQTHTLSWPSLPTNALQRRSVSAWSSVGTYWNEKASLCRWPGPPSRPWHAAPISVVDDNVQGRLVRVPRTRAVGVQRLRNDTQEDAQHHIERCPIALHEVAQSLGHRQHPLTH
jgi:hypothetical protein